MSGHEWIEHNGGPCPVADGIEVEVKLRNGETMFGADWNWERPHWLNADRHIIAYRLASPPAAPCKIDHSLLNDPRQCPLCGVDEVAPAAPAGVECEQCKGTGVNGYKAHTPDPEHWEPLRCSACDGFGRTDKPPARLARDMTVRERMAMAAMQGLVANAERDGNHRAFAVDAVEFADALLAALGEKGDE